MKRDPRDIEDILEHSLPSASDEQMEPALDRIFSRLQSDTGAAMDGPVDFKSVRGFGLPRLAKVGAVAALVFIAIWLGIAWHNRGEFAVLETADGSLVRISDGATVPVTEGERIGAQQLVRSSDDAGAMLRLTDGSRVEMRSQSELLLERAGDGIRIRLNRGGVIVNAAKQRSGHLYVQTKEVSVSVIGTIFLVNAEEEGSRVAVIEGEVRVQHGTSKNTLRRGEQVATSPLMEPQPLAEEFSWSRNAESHMALLQRPGNTLPTTAAGSVTGLVRTAGGSPASGIRVTAMRTDSVDQVSGAMASLAATDTLGRYRLENVPPGNYYVTAGRVGLPTFYPGTLEIAKADVVPISSGATVVGIDFVFQESSATLPPAARSVTGVAGSTSPTDCERWPSCTPAEARTLLLADPLVLFNFPQQRMWNRLALSTPIPTGPNGGFFFPTAWSDEDLENRLGLTQPQRLKIDAIADAYYQVFLPNHEEFIREEAILKRMVAPESKELPKTVSLQVGRVLALRQVWEAGNLKVTQEILDVLTDSQKAQLQTEKFDNNPRLGGVFISDLRATSAKLPESAHGR